MISEAIGKLVLRKDLAGAEMEQVMKEIAMGVASTEQTASFITALRMKGETPEEITAAARVIQDKALNIDGGSDLVSLDREEITAERETIIKTATRFTEGTNTFNISTAAALTAAGGGVKVAKYVRRSSPPFCGCADVIEAMGINLDLTPSQLERCIREEGLLFLYEPLVRNSLQPVTAVRQKMGIRTIFNLLDPLINPARAKAKVLGVYDPGLTETMAIVLRNLEIKRALVVYGEDSLDEISITGKTMVTELQDGEIKTYFISPEDFGMKTAEIDEIKGGTKTRNAEIVLEILRGNRGAKRDITVFNAAAVFLAAGKAKDFNEGIELGNRSIDSGNALKKLERLIEFTNAEHRFLRTTSEVLDLITNTPGQLSFLK